MKKICHITLLNPVNHPRIYAKYAKSQLKDGHQVIICGKDVKNFSDPNIKFFTHPDFDRLSILRIWYNFRLFIKMFTLNADIFFIHSPELLWLACFFSFFSKSKWIYDVHEKYEDNLIYHRGWNKNIKKILSFMTKKWERFAVRYFIDAVVYSEKGFDNHLDAKKFYYLCNGLESFETSTLKRQTESPYLLVSGNISENWGSILALEIFEKYFSEKYHLIYVGKCPDANEIEKLENKIQNSKYKDKIQTYGLTTYISHHEILAWTKYASFLFCLYENNPAISNRIPTKMMEAWAFKIPIIFSNIANWKKLNIDYHFGISIDELGIFEQNFYTENIPSSEYSWEEMYEKFKIELPYDKLIGS